MSDVNEISEEYEANLIHYDYELGVTEPILDDWGDEMLGWYWQIVNKKDGAIESGPHGPFNSVEEVREACLKAWDEGDW